MADVPDVAETFARLWATGRHPELREFLTACAALTPDQLAALVLIDQRERARVGRLKPAEDYLAALPELAADADLTIDVVYHEYLLKEQNGERPTAEEYARRFPQFAAGLTDQIGLHNALASTPTAPSASTTIGHTPQTGDRTRPRFPDLPTHFGRYGVLKLLGRGGMGDVYLAEDVLLGRQVALKLPHFANLDSEAIARFRREAQIAAGFHHPNLCPIYDFGEDHGVVFLTMPYIVGQPLSLLLAERGRLPAEEAVPLIARVARAMAVAHQAGVVHRDLKPANILVKENGDPVVTDFGLARRSAAADPLLTGVGALVGTPSYMAPEQIGASTDEIGPACDVYSLGVVLYETVAGQTPFQGPIHQLLRQILIAKPPALSEAVAGVSPALAAVCSRALAKEPGERFASMDDFADALMQVSDSRFEPVPLPREHTVAAPPRLSRRTILLGSGLALCALIALSLVWRWLGNSSPHSTTVANDAITAGSVWEGRFQFVGMDYEGDVKVTIEERSDDEFYGTYETENASYVWVIHGTLNGEKIHWEFTAVVREKEPRGMVGRAYVEGVCRGSQMDVIFRHPKYNSRAKMSFVRTE